MSYAKADMCATMLPITVSKFDTKETIAQVGEHNKALEAVCGK